MITMIYPSNVMKAWPFVVPLLEPALFIAETHTSEDVRRMVLGGQAQLWLDWEDGVRAIVLTEFVNYPRGVWLRLWLAGSKRGEKIDWKSIFDFLKGFAEENGCSGIEDCGRIGWDTYAPKEAKKIGVMRRMKLTTGKKLMKAG